jgi:MFS family permease
MKSRLSGSVDTTRTEPASASEPADDPGSESSSRATRAMLLVSASVLLGSSTWFSGTAVVSTLSVRWSLTEAQSAWLTIGVQLGFITGTFIYAYLNLADRFNARRVFLLSAVAAAAFNAGFALGSRGLVSGVVFRFLTGVALAGVYPVGMKIIASWFKSGLGWRLGVLVGALTLGTALPYLIRAIGASFDWRVLVLTASIAALLGGAVMILGVGDGPYLKKRASFDGRMLFKVFAAERFRYTALGYFGHMWELYAFWSLGAFYLGSRLNAEGTQPGRLLPLLAFLTVAMGAVGCVAGGWISRSLGERNVALVSLVVSGMLCALSGFAFELPVSLLTVYMLIWGVFVVSDSPQFSALAARYCPPEYTGTALTVQNGIGFAVTVVSIQLLPFLASGVGWRWAMVFLTIGPALGAHFMSRLPSE